MTIARRKLLQLAAGILTFPVLTSTARAENYPVRPIRVIVPQAAGESEALVVEILEESQEAAGQRRGDARAASADGADILDGPLTDREAQAKPRAIETSLFERQKQGLQRTRQ